VIVRGWPSELNLLSEVRQPNRCRPSHPFRPSRRPGDAVALTAPGVEASAVQQDAAEEPAAVRLDAAEHTLHPASAARR
jgi:hypothetical protein